MSQPSDRRLADRWVMMVAWFLGGVVFLYFGVFVALMLDGAVFKTHMIENGIRNVSPELHTAVGDVLRVVYFPLVWLAEKSGLL